jgi:archaellum component FlaC
MSTGTIDGRLAHLEGAYDQISDRLNGMDRRLEGLDEQVRALRDTLVARMDRQFFWLMGIMLLSIVLPLAGRSAGR